MNRETIMYYATVQETALDREIARRTKQKRMRREAHHNNRTVEPKNVRAFPNKEK